MNVTSFPETPNGDNDGAAWVGMFIRDREHICQRITNLMGRKPSDLIVRIMYLDRTISFSGKLISCRNMHRLCYLYFCCCIKLVLT